MSSGPGAAVAEMDGDACALQHLDEVLSARLFRRQRYRLEPAIGCSQHPLGKLDAGQLDIFGIVCAGRAEDRALAVDAERPRPRGLDRLGREAAQRRFHQPGRKARDRGKKTGDAVAQQKLRVTRDCALLGIVVKMLAIAMLQQVDHAGKEDRARSVDHLPVFPGIGGRGDDAGDAVALDQQIGRCR